MNNDSQESQAEVEVTLTPEIESIFKSELGIEIEMLQGFSEKLPDGRTYFKFTVHGHKAEIMREIGLKLLSQSHTKNLS